KPEPPAARAPKAGAEGAVDRLVTGNNGVGNASQDAARLADSLEFGGRKEAEIRQDRIHAYRAVAFADHAAVAFAPARVGGAEFEYAAVIQRNEYLDGGKRGCDPRLGSATMHRVGCAPAPLILVRQV